MSYSAATAPRNAIPRHVRLVNSNGSSCAHNTAARVIYYNTVMRKTLSGSRSLEPIVKVMQVLYSTWQPLSVRLAMCDVDNHNIR